MTKITILFEVLDGMTAEQLHELLCRAIYEDSVSALVDLDEEVLDISIVKEK